MDMKEHLAVFERKPFQLQEQLLDAFLAMKKELRTL